LQTQLKAAQVTDAAINLQLFGMPVLWIFSISSKLNAMLCSDNSFSSTFVPGCCDWFIALNGKFLCKEARDWLYMKMQVPYTKLPHPYKYSQALS
jgi:hypothetical protein